MSDDAGGGRLLKGERPQQVRGWGGGGRRSSCRRTREAGRLALRRCCLLVLLPPGAGPENSQRLRMPCVVPEEGQ